MLFPTRLLPLMAALFLPAAQAADEAVMWLNPSGGEASRQAVLLETEVDMRVTGLLGRVQVRQRFFNDSDDWAEGRYVFPLPGEAAVDAMWIRIGDRVIAGEIHEREQARKIYEQARERGQHAGLVEQERANLFTTSVANIAPGQEIEIRIGFDVPVDYDNGRFSLRFPTTVVPRFIPGSPADTDPDEMVGRTPNTDQVPDAARITPPIRHPASGPARQLDLSVTLNPGLDLGSVNSLHHPVDIRRDGETWRIELLPDTAAARKDFELTWQPRDPDRAALAVFTEQRADADYVLAMLVPPRPEATRTPPREVIYIIDSSGSMQGEAMVQARAALRLGLDRLGPDDRFNVIEFDNLARGLFDSPQPAGERNLQRARGFVDALVADGGTVMGPPLEMAMAGQPPEGLFRQIVFVTDGAVGNESSLLAAIARDIGTARLFSVGIGHGVNADFMRATARIGRGSHTLIADSTQIRDRMNGLLTRLEQPAIRELDLDLGDTAAVYPDPLPDLYAGEPLMITARLTDAPRQLTVNGYRDGRPWTRYVDLDASQRAPGIARLWARERIRSLKDRRIAGADGETVRREITATALEYGLLSDYTSLVAVDRTPARSQEAALKRHDVPGELPEGREMEGFFDARAMPSTATGYRASLLRGLLAAAALVLLAGLSRRRERVQAGPGR